jgi:hypothetical protein
MATRGLTVVGVDKVIQNLMRLQSQLRVAIPTALSEAADVLRDNAITNLQGSIGTGRWGPWGHSIEHEAISNPSTWVKEHTKLNELILQCNSKHAMVVEFGGGFGVGVAGAAMVEKQNGVFPIGASEGGEIFFRPRFAVQRGYAYTTRAMSSPTTIRGMLNEVSKILNRTLMSVST